MKDKIKIYIILVLIIGILVGGFFIWQNHQKTIERKYQACLGVCDIKSPNLDDTSAGLLTKFVARQENEKCQASCREKYAK